MPWGLTPLRALTVGVAASALSFGVLFLLGRTSSGADWPRPDPVPASAHRLGPAPKLPPLRAVNRRKAAPTPAPAPVAVAPPSPPPAPPKRPPRSATENPVETPRSVPTLTPSPEPPVTPQPPPAAPAPRPAPKPPPDTTFDDSG